MATEALPVARADETRWAAFRGLWRFDHETASYSGPSSDEGIHSYGVALTNWNLTDGQVRVGVEFSQVETEGQISAGIVLGFQSEHSRYVLVQLGAYGRAYSIAEWLPGSGWRAIENAGSARNLDPGKKYAMHVNQTGQKIRLAVDGVRVIERILDEPLSGSQLGLFAWGEAPNSFP